MKRILACFLCLAMLLTACGQPASQLAQPTATPAPTTTPAPEEETSFESLDLETEPPEFNSLSDPNLLQYVEDAVYADLTANFSSDDYRIDNITTAYISQEYLEEINYNSQSNIFFGYTLAELDDEFQGKRYVFTLGEDGQTTVQQLQEIEDLSQEEILKNVAIGAGVILVCVTVSCLTAGAGVPTTVSVIFAAAAKTGTAFALSSAAFSGISAGVVRGYQTGDMEEALEAAALAGSEDFKWGAIAGAVTGGGSKALSIYRSSRVQPTFRQSEQRVAELTDGGVEQVAYFDHKEVSLTTPGSTRPDVVVRNPNGTVLAKEVKNYNLESPSSLSELVWELRRQVSDRLRHLPSGSTQEIVLDVRGRGYSTDFLNKIVDYIKSKLVDIYPDIPVTVLRYS